ncbi:single-stranded DNA-binding protein [Streptomyces pacificus]|nr:single-stranded DNA-binding protein [Streptomyces pacificus]
MVTLTGNVATAVEYRDSATGGRARFRFAVPSRRWDRQRDGWTDGPTSFYTVWAWRALGANLAASVAVGEPLVVHGRLRVREEEWEGKPRTSVDIDAVAAGHDLARGTSAFRRVTRTEARLTGRQAAATSPASPPPSVTAAVPPAPAAVDLPARTPPPPTPPPTSTPPPTPPAAPAPPTVSAEVPALSAPSAPALTAVSAVTAVTAQTAGVDPFRPGRSDSAGPAPDRSRAASGRTQGRGRPAGTAGRESVPAPRHKMSLIGADVRITEPGGVRCLP